VGGALLFVGNEVAGLHDLGVPEEFQGRGIGKALVDHASRVAAEAGSPAIVLLATGEGERVYLRCGFTEVARFGYWFKSFQREAI
jgi:predicted N-acetyltransferase YhbS